MSGAIGKRMPRPDAPFKVTGRLQYVDDLSFPRMLHARLVRSPYAHARILRVDTSKAAALPGVHAVITARDMPGRRIGYRYDNLPLQGEKVRYAGDAVAAVAARDPETAARAAELVEVEYEPLPVLSDPEKAMEPGAPLVHEEDWLDPAGERRRPRRDNVSLHFHFEHGDPDRAFAECDVVVEARFAVPFVTTASMETTGCIAVWDPTGNLTMYTPTQAPFLYQREMAEALGISGRRIRVIGTPIGGAFGKNLEAHPWDIVAAVLSRITGRPVKLVFNRQEEFLASRTRQPHIMYVRAGAKKDGRLWVRTCKAVLDNGAYNSWGALTPIVSMQTFTSLYRVPHVRYDAYVVYTNNPYSGSMRGFGNPEATFAVEQTMDMLAEKLGMDPLEFRLRNANEPGEVTPQGMKITSCAAREALEAAARAVEWSGRDARRDAGDTKRRGVGIAGVLHVSGGARIYRSDGCGAIVKIDDFGRVTVLSGHSDMGQGADAAVAQACAEELGVSPEDVTVVNRDTTIVPWDVGVHASRTTFIAGNAVRLAAREAKQQLLRAAAELFFAGAAPEELDIRDGRVFRRSDPANGVPYDKVVRALHFREKGNLIIGHAFYDPPTQMQDAGYVGNISAAYGFGAQAAEVEVDLETGRVRVLRVAAAHDVGKAINPAGIEGQIDGGVLMGVGYALSEQMILQDGQILNPFLRAYGLPAATDAPAIERIIIESADAEGPFGAKGVAEHTVVPTAAAIANAIAHATGVRLYELPMTPERVLRALLEKQPAAAAAPAASVRGSVRAGAE